MVYIIRCCRDFCEKAYFSQANPIQVCWWDCTPHSVIEDFSVSVGVGFAKSLAIKMLLLAAVESQLTDAELEAFLPQMKALFSVRCIHKRASSKKEDRFECLQEKFAQSSRPRPDPLQVASMLSAQCMEEGTTWDVRAASLIAEFQEGSSGERRILSELETQIVKMIPLLEEGSKALLAYHWSNFQAKQSALPLQAGGVRSDGERNEATNR